jgi:protocatechuate 3,4-dioxygenase alpha subunit
MVNELDYLKESASQTAGPYVHIGLAPHQAGFDIFEKNFTNVVAPPGVAGERITIEGRVIDGSGTPVRDVLIELWQANAAGRYNHPADRQRQAARSHSRLGRGLLRLQHRRLDVRDDQARRGGRPQRGRWRRTSICGSSRAASTSACHAHVFSDEAEANAADPVLNLIEWEVRRKTLIASATRGGKSSTASTSLCRDRRKPSSSTSDPSNFSAVLDHGDRLRASGRPARPAGADSCIHRREVIPLEHDPRRTPHGPAEELKRALNDKARAAGLLSPHVAREYGGLALSHVGAQWRSRKPATRRSTRRAERGRARRGTCTCWKRWRRLLRRSGGCVRSQPRRSARASA